MRVCKTDLGIKQANEMSVMNNDIDLGSLVPSRPRWNIRCEVTLLCSFPSLTLSLDKRVKAWGRGWDLSFDIEKYFALSEGTPI